MVVKMYSLTRTYIRIILAVNVGTVPIKRLTLSILQRELQNGEEEEEEEEMKNGRMITLKEPNSS